MEALLTGKNPASVLSFDNDVKRTPLHAAGNDKDRHIFPWFLYFFRFCIHENIHVFL